TGREAVALMQRLVKEEGSTILMVTHDNRILDIADRLIELVDGTIEADREGGALLHKGDFFML
ncbi:MAG: ABC transporter ATP-binding protein, partial [Pseudanabaenaceae cyanobacterium]